MGENMLLFLRLIFVHLMWSSSVAFFSCKKHNVVLHSWKKKFCMSINQFSLSLCCRTHGWLRSLALVNSTVQAFLQNVPSYCSPPGQHPGVVQLVHNPSLFLVSWQTSILIYIGAGPLHTPPPATHKMSPLSPSSQSLLLFCFLNNCRSDWGEMDSQHGFNVRFSDAWWSWPCFKCLPAICIFSFESCLFLAWGHLLTELLISSFFMFSRNWSPVRHLTSKDSLWFCRLAFDLIDSLLGYVEV